MDIMNFITQPQVLITIAVVIMLLWRISYGYRNGLVSELLEIAALAVAVVIITVSADAIDRLLGHGSLNIIRMIIRIAIVVAIYRVIQGIAKGAKNIGKIPILGSANRFLGAAFGFIEVYIWMYILGYIIGYDFGGAVSYTLNGIADMTGRINF